MPSNPPGEAIRADEISSAFSEMRLRSLLARNLSIPNRMNAMVFRQMSRMTMCFGSGICELGLLVPVRITGLPGN